MTKRRIDDLVRSERHFTSGLLLHVLLADRFAGVGALVDLLVERGILPSSPCDDVQVLSRAQVVAEFAVTRDLTARGTALPEDSPRDVVDVAIVVGDLLIAIEAKFFTRPDVASVREQLERQRRALDAIVRDPAFGVTRVVQLFLEHERHLDAGVIGCHGVIDWSDVYEIAVLVFGESSYVARSLAEAMERCTTEFAPADRFWEVANFDEVVRRCRDEPRTLVGYAKGLAHLRDARLETLKRRPWKWFVPAEGTARRNWVSAAVFLRAVEGVEGAR